MQAPPFLVPPRHVAQELEDMAVSSTGDKMAAPLPRTCLIDLTFHVQERERLHDRKRNFACPTVVYCLP